MVYDHFEKGFEKQSGDLEAETVLKRFRDSLGVVIVDFEESCVWGSEGAMNFGHCRGDKIIIQDGIMYEKNPLLNYNMIAEVFGHLIMPMINSN